MTKHRKHNPSKKTLNNKKELLLAGDYLREKQLIDDLSCKIKEKCSLDNVMPAKVNIPYPKIQVKSKNKMYAQILSNDFCGMVSELSAITQYINHEIRMTDQYCNAARTILSISKTEMMHMQTIGELLILLGENVNYNFYSQGEYSLWSPKFVDFGTNYVNMILLDINDEYKAIRQYENHIKMIDDPCIKQILQRIIKDEQYHIELLTSLLDDNNYSKTPDLIKN